jgi:uncharacterized protein
MKKSLRLQTIYGDCTITEPILIELINHPVIQRLKKIHQGGITFYANSIKYKDISRYDHSIGVLALLVRYNATIKEQIAGLLHDASHTVFSHVAEHVFEHKSHESSYQDNIHEWFLEQQKIETILEKYDFSLHEILHKSGHHKILEQDLPDICIDRFDYNLEVAFYNNLIKQKSINLILDNLNFENETWFFTNIDIAKKFATLPLTMIQKFWAAASNLIIYYWMGDVLNKALQKNIITNHEIHFSTDDVVIEKLEKSNDKEITSLLNKIKTHNQHFKISTPDDYDKFLHGKFRGINPWIKIENGFKRLTELDPEFKKEYERVKSLVKKGYYIKFK